MVQNKRAIGIDLGTNTTKIGFRIDNKIKIVTTTSFDLTTLVTLRKVKQIVEEQLSGGEVDCALITVPADFNDS